MGKQHQTFSEASDNWADAAAVLRERLRNTGPGLALQRLSKYIGQHAWARNLLYSLSYILFSLALIELLQAVMGSK